MPTPVPPPSRPSPASLLWLPLGILGGSALALARARGLVAQGLARPEADEALVEWRVAGGLSADLVAGLLLALLAAWLARAVLGRGAGAVRVLAAALIAAGLGWLACAGGPWTPRAYRLELVEGGASGPLLVAALGFALALVLALRAAVRAGAGVARARDRGPRRARATRGLPQGVLP
jgi:hypothetical protein